MEEIYSKINPNKRLHILFRRSEIVKGRLDIITGENFIQCSALNLEKGQTFKAHQHVWKNGPEKVIAQESWVVVAGRVKCLFYDTDGKYLCDRVLNQGDASFTLEGGHNYVSLLPNTLVYEYKTGPYQGQALDKIFLEEGKN